MSEQKHALLVEDDSVDLEAAIRELSTGKASYRFTSAKRLDIACKILNEQSVDVILLDLGLPDGAGVESVRTIRKCTDVPIVVLTAWDSAFASKITDAGANAYISKAKIGNGGLEKAIGRAMNGLAATPSSTVAKQLNIKPSENQSAKAKISNSELIDMVTQLRICCSDLTLNHPKLANLDEVQAIARIAKQLHEKLR